MIVAAWRRLRKCVDVCFFCSYKKRWAVFEWDESKRWTNLCKHGVDFSAAESFEFETALVSADVRSSYYEVRLVAIGFIASRVHVMVFTIRETSVRVISLRKANRKEVEGYVETLGRD